MGAMKALLGDTPYVPSARRTDPPTSHQAAAANQLIRRKDRWDVLAAHFEHSIGGLTDFELAAILQRQQTSVGKRRGELRDVGLIEALHDRRPAPSGSAAIVWRITEAGKRAIRESVK